MFIKSLKLKNFRNYSDLNIDFKNNKILFIGKNAQGKTNLLEAIYYLASLNSFRAKNNIELINHNEEYCSIKADIVKYDTDTSLEVIMSKQGRRKLKVNELQKNKLSDFLGNISAVSFTVNDLLLLRGTPDDRRNGIDDAICQIFPAYSERLLKYNKIKTQKNNFLKSLKGNINADTALLDVWNEQLAVTGSNIIFIRINFLHELLKITKEKHKKISQNEDLSFVYNSSVLGDININEKFGENAEYILEKFKQILSQKTSEEILRAQSVTGPHRDDISFYINGKDAKKFASQGQQRTIVLAVKLAELSLIKEKTATDAVLLLDDVLAELDELRQNFLLDAIGSDTQTIITSVDTLHFKQQYLEDVQIFEIKNNEVYEK